MSKTKQSNFANYIGHPPNHKVGAIFKSRAELKDSGIHGSLNKGIHGSSQFGCYSIVVNGGCENLDNFRTLTYIGEGGKEYKKGSFHSDKVLYDQEKVRGNLALVRSCQRRRPVRVIRGGNSPHGPNQKGWYRYDGLYFVDSFDYVTADHGKRVFRFYLSIDPSTWNEPMPKSQRSNVSDRLKEVEGEGENVGSCSKQALGKDKRYSSSSISEVSGEGNENRRIACLSRASAKR
ncbi:hypothetical protein HK098_003807 [Nowakowskiella sp. JEL0407]|nr:hypothetical protein HK098_003807 [Nowakowskiella sp. JEL0407]